MHRRGLGWTFADLFSPLFNATAAVQAVSPTIISGAPQATPEQIAALAPAPVSQDIIGIAQGAEGAAGDVIDTAGSVIHAAACAAKCGLFQTCNAETGACETSWTFVVLLIAAGLVTVALVPALGRGRR